jgi:hypothetical protein
LSNQEGSRVVPILDSIAAFNIKEFAFVSSLKETLDGVLDILRSRIFDEIDLIGMRIGICLE